MWRATNTSFTRQQCLGKAMEYEWLAENSRSQRAAACAFYQARYWKSLALVARSDGSDGGDESPA
jgi:hypothetical protein